MMALYRHLDNGGVLVATYLGRKCLAILLAGARRRLIHVLYLVFHLSHADSHAQELIYYLRTVLIHVH
jgi:hypothetical protein